MHFSYYHSQKILIGCIIFFYPPKKSGKDLSSKDLLKIHNRFVNKANNLGLLDPGIQHLPTNRKKGIILVTDSTFLITAGSTRGQSIFAE